MAQRKCNKKIEGVETEFGYDLVIERDKGNSIRILTGNTSLDFWKRLKQLADDVVDDIENQQFIGRLE